MDVKKEITAFLEFVDSIETKYNEAQKTFEEAQKTNIDGLHYLEFVENASSIELANAARKLQLSQRQRREAKDFIEIAAPVMTWVSHHTKALESLRGILAIEHAAELPADERTYMPKTGNFVKEIASCGKLPPPKPVIWIDKHGNESYFQSIASAARALDIDRNDILACCRYEIGDVDGQRFRFYSDSLDAKYRPDDIEEEETELEPEQPIPANARPIRGIDGAGNVIEFPSTSAAARALGCAAPSIAAVLKGKGKTCKGYRWEYIT